jgi:hypothetical protein
MVNDTAVARYVENRAKILKLRANGIEALFPNMGSFELQSRLRILCGRVYLNYYQAISFLPHSD